MRKLSGVAGLLVAILAIAMSVYHLYIRLTPLPPDSQVLRALTLLFSLVLAFFLFPARKRSPADRVSWPDLALAVASLAAVAYTFVYSALSAKHPRLGQVASNATKAALVSLTESLAGELAPDGIRVNAVCPGLIRNARWEARIAALAAARGVTRDDAAAALARENIPVGRLGAAEDVAPLVVFLASPVAGYITGVSVEVDGGLGRCIAIRGSV